MKPIRAPRYARQRFPAEVISSAIGLYFRFSLSPYAGEGAILVSYEVIRQWALKVGQSLASHMRRRLPAARDKWHFDGVSRTHF
jgi:putative transposase